MTKGPVELFTFLADVVVPDQGESKRQKTADTLLNILEGRIRNKNTRSAYLTALRSFFAFFVLSI